MWVKSSAVNDRGYKRHGSKIAYSAVSDRGDKLD